MCGSATLTTVESRKAIPEPSTVAASTQRPRAEENASPDSPAAAVGVDIVGRPGPAGGRYPASPVVSRSRTRRAIAVAHSLAGDSSGASIST